jgi:hypothetical protein
LSFDPVDEGIESCPKLIYPWPKAKEKIVKYYVFKGSTGTARAVTDDKTGAKLPKRDFGSWVYERDIDIEPSDPPRIGADSREIVEGVKKDGYFLWPQKPKKED